MRRLAGRVAGRRLPARARRPARGRRPVHHRRPARVQHRALRQCRAAGASRGHCGAAPRTARKLCSRPQVVCSARGDTSTLCQPMLRERRRRWVVLEGGQGGAEWENGGRPGKSGASTSLSEYGIICRSGHEFVRLAAKNASKGGSAPLARGPATWRPRPRQSWLPRPASWHKLPLGPRAWWNGRRAGLKIQ